MPSDSKRIAKNTIFLYIRMLVVMIINLYTTRALLIALGVDDYGLYNVVCGFVSMFSFLNTSMANGTQRFYNYEIGKNGDVGISKIYTHALFIQLILLLIIILGIETFGLWYLDNKMVIPPGRDFAARWIFQCSMLNLFFVVVTVPYSAAIMAYERMGFYATLSIIDAILKLIIVIVLPFLSHDHLVWFGSLVTTISILNFLLNYLFCKIKFRDMKIDNNIRKDIFSSMLSFSGWNAFGSFANMFRGQGMNLVYNYFWGTAINAANGISGQVNAAVESLTQGFLVAVRPQMIKNYAAGKEDYMVRMTFSISKLTFYLVMILAIPLICEISTILDVWLGKRQYPEITVVFCQLTMLMSLFGSFAAPLSIIVHATGKMKKFQIITSLIVFSVVPAAYLLSALGGSVTHILILAIVFVIIAQINRLLLIKEIVAFSIRKFMIEVIIPAFFVFAVCLLFTYGMHSLLPHGFISSLIVIAGSISMSCCIIFFAGLNSMERTLLLSCINHRNIK